MSEPQNDTLLADRYRLVERQPNGRLGERHLAEAIELGRLAVVEFVAPALVADEELRASFETAAASVASLRHAALLGLLELGRHEDGQDYIVTEHPEGEALEAFLSREAPIDPVRVVAMGFKLADALAQVHSQGLVHGAVCARHMFHVAYDDGRELIRLGFQFLNEVSNKFSFKSPSNWLGLKVFC